MAVISALCCPSDAEKRQKTMAYTAGVIFALGWWLWIDVVAVASDKEYSINGLYWIPGIAASIILILINSVDSSKIAEGDDTGSRAVAWFFAWFILLGCTYVAAWWIAVEAFLPKSGDEQLAGFALIIKNSCIFASAMMYRYGVKLSDSSSGWW